MECLHCLQRLRCCTKSQMVLAVMQREAAVLLKAYQVRFINSGPTESCKDNHIKKEEDASQNYALKAASSSKRQPPDLPTTCCMTGCANCVWIDYAEKLKEYYCDGGKTAREEIMKIEDSNMRAFLLLEIS